MDGSAELFQEWRLADRNARTLEQRVLRASLLAIDDKAELPTAQDIDRARRMRGAANDLFALAMDEMERRAAAAKR